MSEVQDFSMSKSKSSGNTPGSPSTTNTPAFSSGKGKLDNMLTKLMKKNNCVSIYDMNLYSPYFEFVVIYDFIYLLCSPLKNL